MLKLLKRIIFFMMEGKLIVVRNMRLNKHKCSHITIKARASYNDIFQLVDFSTITSFQKNER